MKCAIGIDIGGTTIKLGIVNTKGMLLAHSTIPTVASSPLKSVRLASRSAFLLAARAGIGRNDIRCCGVGVPGLIDARRTILLSSPNLPRWRRIPLMKMFSSEMRLPVHIENDANLAAYGEYMHGAGRGCRSFALLTLGTGIGGGIVLNDSLWRGAKGCAAEFGHIPIKPGGRLCGCGRRGCVEQYASAGALIRRYRRGKPGATASSAKEVFDAANRGSRPAKSAIRDISRALSPAIAAIVAILDPDRIVLSGGMSEAGNLLLTGVRREGTRILPRSFRSTRIVKGKLGNRAGIVGAAAWAWKNCALLRT